MSDVPLNADNALVVRNVKPISWSGREYGVRVLKGDSPLLRLQTPVGEQALFVVEPILYFGIVQSKRFISKSQKYRSSEIEEMCEALEDFDLRNYPNGLKVTLKESTDGRFTLTGENM